MEVKPKVTFHAIEKYENEMHRLKKKVKCSETDILNIFSKAEKEIITPGLLRRIMENNFQETDFYRYRGWRLVVCDNTIVTVERDTFDFKGKGYMSKRALRRKSHRKSR